jgi:uncharacterized membrane protein YhaH (DUF805 family)
MSLQGAIRNGFANYVRFSGRARRSEYWFWVLFTIIVSAITSVLDSLAGTSTSSGVGLFSTIAGLALLLPGLAVFWRRMHDIGKSGLWYLTLLIPVANIVFFVILIVWACKDSQPGSNQYGPNPKGIGGEYPGQPGQFGQYGGPAQYGQPGQF